MTGMDNTWQLGDIGDALEAIARHPDRDRDYVVPEGPFRIVVNPHTPIWGEEPAGGTGRTVVGHQCSVQALQDDTGRHLLAEGATTDPDELPEVVRAVRARAHARLASITPDSRRRIRHATTALRVAEEELRVAQDRQRRVLRAAVRSGVAAEDAAADAGVTVDEVRAAVADDPAGPSLVPGV